MTGAMKNAFGGLSIPTPLDTSVIHELVDLLAPGDPPAFRCRTLHIAGDGRAARHAPARQEPHLASADQVAVDAIAAKLGADPLSLKFIAFTIGLGCGDPAVEVIGMDIDGINFAFRSDEETLAAVRN
jgi:hypothetical protein